MTQVSPAVLEAAKAAYESNTILLCADKAIEEAVKAALAGHEESKPKIWRKFSEESVPPYAKDILVLTRDKDCKFTAWHSAIVYKTFIYVDEINSKFGIYINLDGSCESGFASATIDGAIPMYWAYAYDILPQGEEL